VTGLAVAVTLVALVLLLNTVIYTQNLATRGAGVEDGEAVDFRQEVVEGVGGVIDAENREEYDSRTKVEDNVTAGVTRFDALLSKYYAESVTVADVEEESLSLTDGVLLHQTNASRNFTNVDGSSSNWKLAGDVGNARNVRLTVSGENLSDGRSGSFNVRLAGDGGSEWRVYLYNDSDDDIAVAVENGTDDPEVACTASGPEATVDLTRGTINGTPCPKLVWATGVSAPYEVTFRNADAVTGTYEMTVDAPEAAVQKSNFAEPGDEDSPRWAYAVYAAEFEIHFETPNLVFHTTLRVAPGEPE
jgi:hypothetical protein